MPHASVAVLTRRYPSSGSRNNISSLQNVKKKTEEEGCREAADMRQPWLLVFKVVAKDGVVGQTKLRPHCSRRAQMPDNARAANSSARGEKKSHKDAC